MELLTVREAAKESKMSVGWWRQRIFHKDVRVVRIGRSVFIPRSTLKDVQSTIEPRPDSPYLRGGKI